MEWYAFLEAIGAFVFESVSGDDDAEDEFEDGAGDDVDGGHPLSISALVLLLLLLFLFDLLLKPLVVFMWCWWKIWLLLLLVWELLKWLLR